MSSNSISVQGIGFGPQSTASQGFLGESDVALLSATLIGSGAVSADLSQSGFVSLSATLLGEGAISADLSQVGGFVFLSATLTGSSAVSGALSQSEPPTVDFGGRLRPRDIERIRRIKEDDDEIAAVVSAALITLRMQNYDRTN